MRVAFIGSSDLSLKTAALLIKDGNEIVIIESERQRIQELSESIDASFMHGDGSKPAILKELGPEHTDVLFCLTDSDEINIIAALVARTLEFRKTIVGIRNSDLDPVCSELGLENIIVPNNTIARFLEDMAHGVDVLELHTILKGDARFFSFQVRIEFLKEQGELSLPEHAKIVCLYRAEELVLFDPEQDIRVGDEVVILCRDQVLGELKDRFMNTNNC